MEKFGHFFEFLAALNSAYIVSNHFLEALAEKINRELTGLKCDLTAINLIQQNHFEILVNESSKLPETSPRFKELRTQADNLSQEIATNGNEIEAAIKKCKIAQNFNAFCLFGSLYCLFILLLNGWDFDFHNSYERESFFIFNVISVTWLILHFKKNKADYVSYKKVLLVFFVSGLIFPFFWCIDRWTSFLYCNYDFTVANKILSLIVPTSHFVYYFCRSIKHSKSGYKKIYPKITTLQEQVTDFGKEVSATFRTIEGLQLNLTAAREKPTADRN